MRTETEIFNMNSWIETIKDDLERINSGKQGRFHVYYNSMIIRIIAVIGFFRGITVRSATGSALLHNT